MKRRTFFGALGALAVSPVLSALPPLPEVSGKSIAIRRYSFARHRRIYAWHDPIAIPVRRA
jgi:hypothetical protein